MGQRSGGGSCRFGSGLRMSGSNRLSTPSLMMSGKVMVVLRGCLWLNVVRVGGEMTIAELIDRCINELVAFDKAIQHLPKEQTASLSHRIDELVAGLDILRTGSPFVHSYHVDIKINRHPY